MNHVIKYVFYSGSDNNNGGGGGGDNNTNDDDNENDVDEEGESFWLREYDHYKLLLWIVKALAMYYNNYIYKEPHMVSYNI